MMIDARTLANETSLQADVCIIGAGPAGISLAREFIGQHFRVCLLESGGLEANPEAQELCNGEIVGEPILSPLLTRCRRFGGNANLWCVKIGGGQLGVRYVPLSEIDFEKRDWVPYSGWPFTKSELDPFYERAQAVCQSGPYLYQPEAWQDPNAPQLALDQDHLVTTMFQFGPSQAFTQRYRDELQQADNITVYLNANAVEIEVNDSAKVVNRVRVVCLEGSQFWVSARVIVVAKGGLGNARLLLMSNRQQTKGLGNQHDLVGRFFMDHPLLVGGTFTPSDPDLFNRMALYDLRQVKGISVQGHLALSKSLIEREHLLSISATFFPRPNLRQQQAILAFKDLAEPFIAGEIPSNIPQKLIKILSGLDYVMLASYLAATKHQSMLPGFGRGGWSELPNNQSRFQTFEVCFQTEQMPDPANRVRLSQERDLLGCPKLIVDWHWGDHNRQSVQRAQAIIAEDLARAGLGTFHLKHEGELPSLDGAAGMAHHLGTTRMHVDPTQGVVDEHCRVHGLANLFMAGSSVFPTGGYANPTLTIVALSLRLADHLKQLMAGSTGVELS